MIIENSIKVKNYKCFGHEEQGFEKICPINIIIGKNNSGKSSLIDLIEYLVNPSSNLLGTGTSDSKCIISLLITEELVDKVGSHYSKSNGGGNTSWIGSVRRHAVDYIPNRNVVFELNSNNQLTSISPKKNYGQYETSFMSVFKSSFSGKSFRRISAERDVKPQGSDSTKMLLQPNGDGATNVIRRILNEVKNNNTLNNPDLIQKSLLQKLNDITQPDIKFIDIVARDNGNGEWEIYFRDANSGLIALSKMGSGIKTVLIVLLNLIVIPEIENLKKENLFFGFEELENNLHPSLQRRLFNYISKYALENNCYFFITTHSNIPIDLFNSNNNAQIIHVEKKGDNSFTKTVQTHLDGKSILKDLDFKASDLLLTNGIIWVEGASDAIYLELLLDLYTKSINSDLGKLNYTIHALSTAIWKYAGFIDFDWDKIEANIQNKIISLAKINHNHLLVIDKDDNYEDKKPSEWESFANGTGKNKAKLIHESVLYGEHDEKKLENNFGDTNDDQLYFWINDGTFETYLKFFIENKGKEKFEKFFEINPKLGYFEKKRNGDNSSKSKIELAAEIAKFCINEGFLISDIAPQGTPLLNKIERLYNTIKKSWN